MEDKMIAVKHVAEYLLLCADDKDDGLSNLKLQKLCYYAQGCHLAMFDEPLFHERIEAWMHGPVVPDLYKEYKQYKSDNIPFEKNNYTCKSSGLTKEQIDFLDDVIWQEFGHFTAWRLRDMTHQEKPWLEASMYNNEEITHDALKAYFKTRLV
jgi:uncharacterized phage-associated protein